MKVLHNVVIKQILTNESKINLLKKYNDNKNQLQKECDQLIFELKKLEKSKKIQSNQLKNHFQREINNRDEKIKLIDFQMEQLHILPIGSELKEREVQAILDVNIGDRWEDAIAKTIIIKDGIIHEIR